MNAIGNVDEAGSVSGSRHRSLAVRVLTPCGDVNSILPHYAQQIGKIFNYISLNIELYHSKLQFCIEYVILHPCVIVRYL